VEEKTKLSSSRKMMLVGGDGGRGGADVDTGSG